jgi:hypothetical protein
MHAAPETGRDLRDPDPGPSQAIMSCIQKCYQQVPKQSPVLLLGNYDFQCLFLPVGFAQFVEDSKLAETCADLCSLLVYEALLWYQGFQVEFGSVGTGVTISDAVEHPAC